MANREPIEIGEWYHCYGRGVDKRKTFLDKRDYERFLLSMFLGNSNKSVRVSNFGKQSHKFIFENTDRGENIVEIGAFCLMPNHFHILIKEIVDNGIARFMQKLMTGYTMYFNKKNERAGALFSGTFKSKHINDDIYFKQVVSYIHLNPLKLLRDGWQESTKNTGEIENYLRQYKYSSLPTLYKIQRSENEILSNNLFENMYDKTPTIDEMLKEVIDHQERN